MVGNLRRHTAAFKVRLALKALEGSKTISRVIQRTRDSCQPYPPVTAARSTMTLTPSTVGLPALGELRSHHSHLEMILLLPPLAPYSGQSGIYAWNCKVRNKRPVLCIGPCSALAANDEDVLAPQFLAFDLLQEGGNAAALNLFVQLCQVVGPAPRDGRRRRPARRTRRPPTGAGSRKRRACVETPASTSRKRRRAADLRGEKPRKVKLCSGNPDSTRAVISPVGPGMAETGSPSSSAPRTAENPGSEMPGVPAFVTTATDRPLRSAPT